MVWPLDGGMRCLTEYDKRITIQQLTGSADAHGHINNTTATNWGTYTTSYAKCISQGGREFWKVASVDATVSHVWYCPYSAALKAANPEMRLVMGGVTYEIMSIIDINEAHEEVEIQTKRAV